MKVLIRTDASTELGSGHVARCLTLADGLSTRDIQVCFVTRSMHGDLGDVIAAAGYVVHRLPATTAADNDWHADAEQTATAIGNTQFDWIIVDHYALDYRWESAMRAHARRIMVIDDLGDREHDCDLLLDQNYCENLERRYDGRVPESCVKLLGPRFALLRPEFISFRAKGVRDAAVVRRVLVFLSGADPENLTGRVLNALDEIAAPEVEVDVVIGSSGKHIESLKRYCADRTRRHLHVQTSRMAALLAEADLAIGGGGATSWERACLGVPSVVLGLARNQWPIAEALANSGAHLYLGRVDALDDASLRAGISTALNNRWLRHSFMQASQKITDGRGVNRVLGQLKPPVVSFRLATDDDCDRAFEWRNHPSNRRYAFDSSVVELDAHRRWFRDTLANPSRVLLIGLVDDSDVGVLRYDLQDTAALVSIYLDPARHGQGHGTALLTAGVDWLRSRYPNVRSIVAEVLAENVASAQAFRAAGYRESHQSFRFDLSSAGTTP